MSTSLYALLPDSSISPHGFNALDKEFSSGGHESDGNGNDTEANPRIGFGILLREIALHFLESLRSGRMECESVILAGWVV